MDKKKFLEKAGYVQDWQNPIWVMKLSIANSLSQIMVESLEDDAFKRVVIMELDKMKQELWRKVIEIELMLSE